MPLLDRSGLKADSYTRATPDEVARHSHALVAWVDLPEALASRSRDQRIGVEVPNTVKAGEIRLVQRQLSLIAIRFPAFGDGRGFSLARQLRNHGFLGTLRAVGPLIADQFAYALACGFDEVEPPADLLERQPPQIWAEALTHISQGYQRGYGHGGNILDQRRAARQTTARGASQ
jgi:uncharacterized protein (DUF934 family)